MAKPVVAQSESKSKYMCQKCGAEITAPQGVKQTPQHCGKDAWFRGAL